MTTALATTAAAGCLVEGTQAFGAAPVGLSAQAQETLQLGETTVDSSTHEIVGPEDTGVELQYQTTSYSRASGLGERKMPDRPGPMKIGRFAVEIESVEGLALALSPTPVAPQKSQSTRREMKPVLHSGVKPRSMTWRWSAASPR